MSVAAQLKKFSENPDGSSGKFDRKAIQEVSPASQELEADLQSQPIPGQSLTQSPDSPLPMEGPPQFTDQRKFIDHLFESLTEIDRLPKVLDILRSPVPVEDTALEILRKHMRKGNINTDMLLLCIEPTIYILIALATYADIDPVLYPEGDFDEDESRADMSSQFRNAAAKMTPQDTNKDSKITVEDLTAPAVLPQGIMKRTQEAVKGIK